MALMTCASSSMAKITNKRVDILAPSWGERRRGRTWMTAVELALEWHRGVRLRRLVGAVLLAGADDITHLGELPTPPRPTQLTREPH